MSVKSAVLAVATLGVLALGVYLFIQVRSTPAQAGATQAVRPPAAARTSPPPGVSDPASSSTAPNTPPTPSPVIPTANQPPPRTEVGGPPPPTIVDESKVNLKLDNMMEQANKAYDTQDFDQAIAVAMKVLTKEPNNVRMLRIVVSANCIQGDSVVAQAHYERLPKFDRDQMKTRCDRYGVAFKEPAE